MFEANLKIIKELKSFITILTKHSELLEKFTTQSPAFTRKRKLPFPRMVLLIAKLCKKTLSVEIEKFFEEMEIQLPCTVSAFSQQRMKLSPRFYTAWNEVLTASFYHYCGAQVKRWKNYRLIAADGSNLSLVNTPALQAFFGDKAIRYVLLFKVKYFIAMIF